MYFCFWPECTSLIFGGYKLKLFDSMKNLVNRRLYLVAGLRKICFKHVILKSYLK